MERQNRLMERRRNRNILYLLVHSPNGYNGQSWANPFKARKIITNIETENWVIEIISFTFRKAMTSLASLTGGGKRTLPGRKSLKRKREVEQLEDVAWVYSNIIKNSRIRHQKWLKTFHLIVKPTAYSVHKWRRNQVCFSTTVLFKVRLLPPKQAKSEENLQIQR